MKNGDNSKGFAIAIVLMVVAVVILVISLSKLGDSSKKYRENMNGTTGVVEAVINIDEEQQ